MSDKPDDIPEEAGKRPEPGLTGAGASDADHEGALGAPGGDTPDIQNENSSERSSDGASHLNGVAGPLAYATSGDEPVADEPSGGEPSEEQSSASTEAADEQPSLAEEASQPVEEEPLNFNWYILKVQSNREDSIKEALLRRIAIEGLGKFFKEIIIPEEKVSEFRNGRKRVTRRKLYPGYLVVHMALTDDTWYLVRDTSGIGDFTGSGGKPSPMLPHEVNRIVAKQEEKADEAPKLKISFTSGDRVKITEGTFENFEGDVDTIDQANGRVTVMINIFGRSTPVELEYWQIESL